MGEPTVQMGAGTGDTERGGMAGWKSRADFMVEFTGAKGVNAEA